MMTMPYHVRILTESKGEYRLRPELPEGQDTPMDEYLTRELINGYIFQSITATQPSGRGEPHEVRVVTKRDPPAAERHPAMRGSLGIAPWHYRVFYEDHYQYWTNNDTDGPVSLDEYLRQESERGYNLKSLVGIQAVRDEEGTKEEFFKAKIRVSTEYAG